MAVNLFSGRLATGAGVKMKRERVGPRGDGGRGAAVKEARKSLQLCRVVHETLALVLADEEVDPVLNEVMVSHVEPLAGDAQLLVTLVPAYVDGATPAPEAALVHAA